MIEGVGGECVRVTFQNSKSSMQGRMVPVAAVVLPHMAAGHPVVVKPEVARRWRVQGTWGRRAWVPVQERGRGVWKEPERQRVSRPSLWSVQTLSEIHPAW